VFLDDFSFVACVERELSAFSFCSSKDTKLIESTLMALFNLYFSLKALSLNKVTLGNFSQCFNI
jgi:hypothetical protein